MFVCSLTLGLNKVNRNGLHGVGEGPNGIAWQSSRLGTGFQGSVSPGLIAEHAHTGTVSGDLVATVFSPLIFFMLVSLRTH